MSGVTLKKDQLPNFITYEWLIRSGACEEAEFFKEMYPEGTQITEEVVDALLEEGLDLEFLIKVAYDTYEETLQDRFHKKTDRAHKSYEETEDLLAALLRKAQQSFIRERILALYEITSRGDLPTREGEQYRLDF